MVGIENMHCVHMQTFTPQPPTLPVFEGKYIMNKIVLLSN